jgi:TolB-like protein
VNLNDLLAELKRRSVYQVAITYAVVGWLLIQVTTQVFPFFEIPGWVVRLVVLLILLGFSIALIFAWAFELTPQGIKRTETADQLPPRATRRRGWLYLAVVAGALSVGVFMVGRHLGRAGAAAAGRADAAGGPEKSIAVLPFENLSEEKANAYFAAGIQDEILTRLSKIGALKVIARTSTALYATNPLDVRQIAQELGVANLVEGSVQRAGDQVRIHVQLIDARSDSPLWADTIDRKLTDIFLVESEVAKKVDGPGRENHYRQADEQFARLRCLSPRPGFQFENG